MVLNVGLLYFIISIKMCVIEKKKKYIDKWKIYRKIRFEMRKFI